MTKISYTTTDMVIVATPTDDDETMLYLPFDPTITDKYMECFPTDGHTLFEEPAAAAAMVLAFYYAAQPPSDIEHADVDRVATYLHKWIDNLKTKGLAA